MFEMEIENPLDETVRPLFHFETIQLKFKSSFYGEDGYETDRTKMKIEELDIEYKDWMEHYLKMENGLIEFTIPKTGKYQIVQQSRSSNADAYDMDGPAMGVNVTLELASKKVYYISFGIFR